MTLGLAALPVIAALMLAGVVGATYYSQHLAPVASVNGAQISRDEWEAQERVDTFTWTMRERRITAAAAAGQLDQATAQQDLQYVRQQVAAIPSTALQELIDRTLQAQLASQLGISVSSAEVDAQLAQAATSPEQRQVLAIFVAPGASPFAAPVPEAATPTPSATPAPSRTPIPKSSAKPTSARTPAPTPSPSPTPSATPGAAAGASTGAVTAAQAQVQAQDQAEQAFAALQAGTPFDQVARTYSTDPSAVSGGTYGYVSENDPVDAAWVAALFSLPVGGTTQPILGADGVYRIGRVTAILPSATDPRFRQELAASGVSLAAYRDDLRGGLVRQKLAARVLAQATTGAVQQVHAWEIRIAAGNTAAARLRAVQTVLAQPGADFASVARANSDAPDGTAGGDMGWIAPLQVAPTVQKVLFGLSVGELSQPISEADGTYLYRITERAERPIDASQLVLLRSSAFVNWYPAQRAKANIWRSAGVPSGTAAAEGGTSG